MKFALQESVEKLKVPNNFQMQYTKYQATLSDLYNETIILARITYKEMLYSKCYLIEK